MDIFTAVSDPTRRQMLDLLRSGELPAGDMVRAFPQASQPGVSRHLRVLREAGLVDVRRDEQRRLYSLRAQGFAELDAWISRYRNFWPAQLDALARHLDGPATAPSSTQPSTPSKDETQKS
jgi:DNA-binding transcriptional ArsR family regulator